MYAYLQVQHQMLATQNQCEELPRKLPCMFSKHKVQTKHQNKSTQRNKKISIPPKLVVTNAWKEKTGIVSKMIFHLPINKFSPAEHPVSGISLRGFAAIPNILFLSKTMQSSTQFKLTI